MSWSARIVAALAILIVAVAPPAAMVAPMGMAPLVGAVGAAALVDRWRRGGRLAQPSTPAPWLFAALTLWATVSFLWGVDPAESAARGARLVLEALFGGALFLWAAQPADPDQERVTGRVTLALAGGLAFAALLGLADQATHGLVFSTIKHKQVLPTVGNRGATVMATLVWPAALLLARSGRLWAAGLLLALAAAAVLRLESDAAKLALMVGAAAAVAALALKRCAGPIAAGLVALAILFAPAPALLMGEQPPAWVKPSGAHRLLIWRFAGQKLAERPILGWGLEGSRNLPGGKDPVRVIGRDGEVIEGESMPLHPHNGPLQIWVELGAVGAILAAAALVCTVLSAGRMAEAAATPATARAAVFGGLATALVIAALSYGVWQSWWLGTLFLAAALMRRGLNPRLTAG